MEELKIFNLNVRVGNISLVNDKNEFDQKSQYVGNNKKQLFVLQLICVGFLWL